MGRTYSTASTSYCNVKYEELLDEGGARFLADNGVVLSYKTIPAKYLTFHTRPPHEKDPADRQWERKALSQGQQEALLWERDLVQAHRRQLEALLLWRN